MKPAIKKPDGIQLAPVPQAAMNLYTPKNPFPSTVIDRYRISDRSSPHFCWHVVLSLQGSAMAGRYRIGQSIGVVPEGRFNDLKFNSLSNALDNKIRLYSIASACWGDDWKGETVSLCVKREVEENGDTGKLVFGAASNFICDALLGEKLMITGPVGKSFLLPDNPLGHQYVFVATGTGIAPFRGMLIELFNQGFSGEVWLIFGIPYSTDIMYDEEFRCLAQQHANFHYVTAISREQRNRSGGKRYVQNCLEEEQDRLVPFLQKKETLLYLCGLKGMEFGIYQWLYRTGSNLVSVPPGMSAQGIQELPRDSSEWAKVEKHRDKQRLFKETY